MIATGTPLFPVVRHLSTVVTPALLAMPITANQITTASLLAGLAVGAQVYWITQLARGARDFHV